MLPVEKVDDLRVLKIQDPSDLFGLSEQAKIASSQQNWSELIIAARNMRINYPLAEDAYKYEAQALEAREEFRLAAELLDAASRLFPESEEVIRQRARLANKAGNKDDAIVCWNLVRTRFPDDRHAHFELLWAYRATGQLHNADRVMSDAVARFPEEPNVLVEWADGAIKLSDWREAVQRFQLVREKFPNQLSGYIAPAHALRHLRRCDEADEITEAGLRIFSGSSDLLESYAWTAMVSGDFHEAERRWRALITQHPSNPTGYAGLADAVSQQHRDSEAEDILHLGIMALPENGYLAEAFAWRATRRGDWPEAVQRWQTVRTRFPQGANCHHQLGVALKQVGRLGDAEKVLGEGTILVPDDLPLAVEHAWCANARGDWRDAMNRWQDLASRFPIDITVQEGLVSARLGCSEAGIQIIESSQGIRSNAVDIEDPKEILKNFESVGENCEFGLMQRYFGLEPISLFRWVAIGMTNLAEAIENGFAGVGGPDQTLIQISKGHEYFVADTKYHFTMHTFVQQETIEQNKFFEQQCRRLRYLSNKMLDDFSTAEKIFVFFQFAEIDMEQLLRLHDAMCQHGDVTLLLVVQKDILHFSGTVEQIRPGLLIGYIERFGKTSLSAWDILYQEWLTICRAAYHWHKLKTAVSAPAA